MYSIKRKFSWFSTSGMAEDEDGIIPKLDEPEIKLEAVSTPDVHAMASDVIQDG